MKWVYAVATVFVLMFILNVMGWNTFSNDDQDTTDIETVINEYDLENNFTSLP